MELQLQGDYLDRPQKLLGGARGLLGAGWLNLGALA